MARFLGVGLLRACHPDSTLPEVEYGSSPLPPTTLTEYSRSISASRNNYRITQAIDRAYKIALARFPTGVIQPINRRRFVGGLRATLRSEKAGPIPLPVLDRLRL